MTLRPLLLTLCLGCATAPPARSPLSSTAAESAAALLELPGEPPPPSLSTPQAPIEVQIQRGKTVEHKLLRGGERIDLQRADRLAVRVPPSAGGVAVHVLHQDGAGALTGLYPPPGQWLRLEGEGSGDALLVLSAPRRLTPAEQAQAVAPAGLPGVTVLRLPLRRR